MLLSQINSEIHKFAQEIHFSGNFHNFLKFLRPDSANKLKKKLPNYQTKPENSFGWKNPTLATLLSIPSVTTSCKFVLQIYKTAQNPILNSITPKTPWQSYRNKGGLSPQLLSLKSSKTPA